MTNHDDIHTCSYRCERPTCIRRQRDELVHALEKADARIRQLEEANQRARERVLSLIDRVMEWKR